MSIRAPARRFAESLPAEPTPLLGRERDLAELRGLLDDQSVRLVTITGPGGVGKTRIAVRLARCLADAFGDAIAFVPLAAVRDADLVLPTVAQELGLMGGTAEDLLAYRLGDTPTLLILDNLEHLPAAAPALARLVDCSPRLTVLATSRAPLGVAGEHLFALSPLPVPTATRASSDAVIESAAVTLFAERARAASPAFAVTPANASTIVAICRRLDGLPLAIELAATRTRILSPEALLARMSDRLRVLGGSLRDAPDRLRTMRGAIAWSYDLLAPDEQALFRRLAVFRGGFSLAAAEAVLTDEQDTFELLSVLVDHSLVQADPRDHGEPRFLMLETLRDFGMERLAAEREETDARQAHAQWVASLVESVAACPVSEEQSAWQSLLDPEVENLRAAVDWALARSQPLLALRIGNATWRFCSSRGLTATCRDWLDRALADPALASSRGYVEGLVAAGHLAERQRDLAVAESLLNNAVRLMAGSDPQLESLALLGLGFVNGDRGDYAAAIGFHERVAMLASQSGNRLRGAVALKALGDIAFFQGRFDDARVALERSLAEFSELGDIQAEALCATNLGAVANDTGDAAAGERYLNHALALQRHIDARDSLPITLINLGGHAFARGDFTRVGEVFAEAIDILRETGDRRLLAIALHGPAAVAREAGELAAAARYMIESIRLHSEVEDRLSIVESAEFVASLCSSGGDWGTSVELLGAATANRATLDTEASAATVRDTGTVIEAARRHLTEAAHAAAWAAGEHLDIDALTRRLTVIAREIAGPQQPAISVLGAHPASEATGSTLTPRELEVLRLLVDGHSTAEIAEALFIAPRTASTHIANLLGKLGVSSRTAAVALALRAGIA